MINFCPLAGAKDGAHRPETFLEAELAVQGAGRVVLRANHHEGLVAARSHLLRKTPGQVYAEAFPGNKIIRSMFGLLVCDWQLQYYLKMQAKFGVEI